ncbi:MAG: hypothetical protein KKI20_00090, partial [Gammaproteobacteria bacterium]|nr:hypothetical protein [Gammaproteobacteria bacterium]
WFGLHDDRADIRQSYALLCPSKLLMIFPEITVRNKADYKKWYDGVGKNIRSNLHRVQKLEITFLPHHQYQLHVVVHWRAISRQNKFINMIADQTWLLRDSNSTEHPCIQEYKIREFTPIN